MTNKIVASRGNPKSWFTVFTNLGPRLIHLYICTGETCGVACVHNAASPQATSLVWSDVVKGGDLTDLAVSR
jgi:hypothetical protein